MSHNVKVSNMVISQNSEHENIAQTNNYEFVYILT